jgi:hypothetical protein
MNAADMLLAGKVGYAYNLGSSNKSLRYEVAYFLASGIRCEHHRHHPAVE